MVKIIESGSLKLANFRLKLDDFHTCSSIGFLDKISIAKLLYWVQVLQPQEMESTIV